MKNTKGFANIWLVVLVVAVVVVGGYSVFKKSGVPTPKTEQSQSQQPTTTTNNQPVAANDETAGWQTYRNEKYRFEFKYPTGWKYMPTDLGILNLGILKNSGAVEINGVNPSQILYAGYFNGGGFEFSIYGSNARNCENESTWLPREIRENDNVIKSRSSVVVGNTKSPTVAYERCGSSATPTCYASISVCIPHNPTIAIDFTDGKEDSGKPTAELIAISNKILSTFKFTP